MEPLNSLELLEALKEMWNQATDPGGQGCLDGIEVCPAVSALREQLFQAALDCPGSKFVLVGYSYGAMVIQRYMHLVANPDGFDGDLTIGRNNVVAVLLYGDPTWPQLPEYSPRLGLATSYDLGFRQLEDYIPNVPNGINERFQSWCLSYDLGPPTVEEPYTAYDPICLANPLDVDENFLNCFALGAPEIQCPHRQYIQQGLTQMGADWLATITGVN